MVKSDTTRSIMCQCADAKGLHLLLPECLGKSSIAHTLEGFEMAGGARTNAPCGGFSGEGPRKNKVLSRNFYFRIAWTCTNTPIYA